MEIVIRQDGAYVKLNDAERALFHALARSSVRWAHANRQGADMHTFEETLQMVKDAETLAEGTGALVSGLRKQVADMSQRIGLSADQQAQLDSIFDTASKAKDVLTQAQVDGTAAAGTDVNTNADGTTVGGDDTGADTGVPPDADSGTTPPDATDGNPGTPDRTPGTPPGQEGGPDVANEGPTGGAGA